MGLLNKSSISSEVHDEEMSLAIAPVDLVVTGARSFSSHLLSETMLQGVFVAFAHS
jgi:hypothetical protein